MSDVVIVTGWYRDPVGDSDLRWWEKDHWTRRVQDGGPAYRSAKKADGKGLPQGMPLFTDPKYVGTKDGAAARKAAVATRGELAIGAPVGSDRDTDAKPERGLNFWIVGGALLGASAVVLVAFGLAGYLSGNDYAPLVAFVGTFLTAAVTFVGLVVKDQGDRRIAEESARSERRLQADSAMKAAGLLSLQNGRDGNPATVAGALLALADLGQLRLAISLLFDLWPNGRVSDSAPVVLVDQALRSKDLDIQGNAAVVLQSNVGRLISTTKAGLPVIDWPSDYESAWPVKNKAPKARSFLLDAWNQIFLREWKAVDPKNLYEADRRADYIVGLYAAYSSEDDRSIKTRAAIRLREMLMRWPEPPVESEVDGIPVKIDRTLIPQLDTFLDGEPVPTQIQESFDNWSTPLPDPPMKSGKQKS